jgi:hypothetical protein
LCTLHPSCASRVESSCGAHCLGTPSAARRTPHAAAAVCRSSSAQPCKVLMTTTPKKPSVCCPPPVCCTRTLGLPAARCPRASPAQPRPRLYLGRPNRRISVEPCPLRAYPRRGAWSRRPSFTPSARNTLILRHCCTRASGTLLKQTPPLRLLPALAPNPLAVAASLLWSAPLVACQPCLMALGGAAEWTASPSPSCTHPLQ